MLFFLFYKYSRSYPKNKSKLERSQPSNDPTPYNPPTVHVTVGNDFKEQTQVFLKKKGKWKSTAISHEQIQERKYVTQRHNPMHKNESH